MTTDAIPTVALGDYLAVITRRWRVVVAGALLGSLAAVGYLATAPTTATATAVVNIAAITSDPYNASRSASGLIDMQTEAQSAQSMAVAEGAAELLGDGTEARDIRSRLSVSAIDSTTIIRISVTSPSAARAQAQSDAVAAAFLDYRSTQASERITAVLFQDQSRIEALREQLREANERLLAATAGSLDAIQAETDRQLLTLQINAVLDRTSSFEGVDTSGGQILTPATANAVEYAPSRVTVAGGGLLAGAAFGIVGAFVRQARDRRIHLDADVVAAGVGPVVARLTGGSNPRPGHDVDQLEIAREWVLSSPPFEDGHGVLALLEDRSTASAWDVAADLARVLAEADHPVRVIAVPTSDGYTERLLHRLGLDASARDGHGVLTSRALRSLSAWLPSGLSWAGSTRRHVDVARSESLVLLVCPATATDADRMAVCRIADGALVFAAEQVSQRSGLRDLADVAASMGCEVVGTITSVTGHHSPTAGHGSHSARKGRPAAAPALPALPELPTLRVRPDGSSTEARVADRAEAGTRDEPAGAVGVEATAGSVTDGPAGSAAGTDGPEESEESGRTARSAGSDADDTSHEDDEAAGTDASARTTGTATQPREGAPGAPHPRDGADRGTREPGDREPDAAEGVLFAQPTPDEEVVIVDGPEHADDDEDADAREPAGRA